MIKKIVASSLTLLSLFCFTPAIACPFATATNDPEFCSSFKLAAQCRCTSSGLPARMCMDMNLLYDRMIIIFHSVQKACEFQHDTTTQNCIDSWNCFRNGGTNTQNELCSGTGATCA